MLQNLSVVSWAQSKIINQRKAHLLMIGNELGHSPIHENALTRNFVDKHGEMNQELAKIANHVTFIIAGCPQILKS